METQEGTPPPTSETAADIAQRERWQGDVRERALLVRERNPPKAPRWLVRITIALAVALHLGLLIALRVAMQPPTLSEAAPIEVSLIDAPRPEPPMPDVEREPIPATRSNQHTQVPVAKPPRAAAVDTASPVVPPAEPESGFRAYNMDGTLNIPKDLAAQLDRAQPEPSFKSPTIEMSPIMRHQRPLKIRPNHFAQNWLPPPNESLLGSFVREHLVKQSEFMTPWGTQISCGWIVIMGGCSWGPPPVWKPSFTWKPATALDEY